MKVPATFKIDSTTKDLVDAMSAALGMEKSAFVEEAIQILARDRQSEARRSFDRMLQGAQSPAQAAAGAGRRRARAA